MAQSHDEDFVATQTMIERVIRGLGLDPDKNRQPSTDPRRRAWKIRRGSASVYVLLTETDHGSFLQVVSPLLKLPAQEILPLLRRLLEANGGQLYGAAFGLKGDQVVLSADRSTVDLDEGEVGAMIKTVGRYADEYDDLLIAEYGGTRQRE